MKPARSVITGAALKFRQIIADIFQAGRNGLSRPRTRGARVDCGCGRAGVETGAVGRRRHGQAGRRARNPA